MSKKIFWPDKWFNVSNLVDEKKNCGFDWIEINAQGKKINA